MAYSNAERYQLENSRGTREFRAFLTVALCLILVSSWFFFFGVDNKSLWAKEIDALRAEVIREMVTTGEWMVPHLNGEPTLAKPPLYYWMASSFSVLFGDVTEASMRLPSQLSAIFSLLCVFLIGSRLFGRRVGWLAMLILAANPLYIVMSRSINLDMTLTGWTTASLACFLLGLVETERPQRYFLSGFAFLGLALMTKGPVALLITLPPMLACYRLASRRDDGLLPVRSLGFVTAKGVLILLILTLPWILYILFKVPEAREQIYLETLGRYEGETYIRAKSHFFYLAALPLMFLPWALFLPMGIASAYAKLREKVLRPEILVLMWWVLPSLVLFSVTSSKRDYYLLPLFPALALFVAWAWDEWIKKKEEAAPQEKLPLLFRAPVYCFVTGIATVTIGFAVLIPRYIPEQALIFYLLTPFGLALAGLLIFQLTKHRIRHLFISIVLAMAVGVGVWRASVLPKMDPYRTRKEFFRKAAAMAGPHSLINFRYNGWDLQYYAERTAPFVVKRQVLNELLKGSVPVFVIAQNGDFETLRLWGSYVVFEQKWENPIGSGGGRVLFLIANPAAVEEFRFENGFYE